MGCTRSPTTITIMHMHPKIRIIAYYPKCILHFGGRSCIKLARQPFCAGWGNFIGWFLLLANDILIIIANQIIGHPFWSRRRIISSVFSVASSSRGERREFKGAPPIVVAWKLLQHGLSDNRVAGLWPKSSPLAANKPINRFWVASLVTHAPKTPL